MMSKVALRNYRIALAIFIFGLVVSGMTAFPLELETALLNHIWPIESIKSTSTLWPLRIFLWFVHGGIRDVYARYPFFAYGTDWLGFGHFVIAGFFVLPFRDPVRYRAILHVGLVACAGVIVLALIAGPIRHIPFFWTLIDCSFGVVGALPLLYCLRLTRRVND